MIALIDWSLTSDSQISSQAPNKQGKTPLTVPVCPTSCVLCLRTNKQNRFLQSLNNTQYRPDPGKTETNEGKIFQQAHLNISLEIILSIWIFISLNAIYLYPGNRVVDLSLNKDPLKVSEQNEKFRFRILKTVNLVNLLASGLSKLKFWFSDQT